MFLAPRPVRRRRGERTRQVRVVEPTIEPDGADGDERIGKGRICLGHRPAPDSEDAQRAALGWVGRRRERIDKERVVLLDVHNVLALAGADVPVPQRVASQEDVRERGVPTGARLRERRDVAVIAVLPLAVVPTAGNVGRSQRDRAWRAVGKIDHTPDGARVPILIHGFLEDDPFLIIRVDRPRVQRPDRLQTVRASRGPTRCIEKRIVEHYWVHCGLEIRASRQNIGERVIRIYNTVPL